MSRNGSSKLCTVKSKGWLNLGDKLSRILRVLADWRSTWAVTKMSARLELSGCTRSLASRTVICKVPTAFNGLDARPVAPDFCRCSFLTAAEMAVHCVSKWFNQVRLLETEFARRVMTSWPWMTWKQLSSTPKGGFDMGGISRATHSESGIACGEDH